MSRMPLIWFNHLFNWIKIQDALDDYMVKLGS